LPIQYQELADHLGVAIGDRAPLREVYEAVISIRRRKGMVLDQDDRDTYSAGSFFTNPIVASSKIPTGAPSWPVGDGLSKVSAAWMIEKAGIAKGTREGGAGISSKHVLALTNQENATAAEIHTLAIKCKRAVKDRFGIELESEVRLLGFA
jgi:UDP-N-acetylmuramate dehydrogenase